MEHIDEIIHHRLKDAEVAPPAFVWPNVERELRRRRRRIAFWWLTGGTAVLLAIVALKFGALQPSNLEVRNPEFQQQKHSDVPVATDSQAWQTDVEQPSAAHQPLNVDSRPSTPGSMAVHPKSTADNQPRIQQPTAKGQRSTVDGQPSMVNRQKPVATDQQSAISGQAPAHEVSKVEEQPDHQKIETPETHSDLATLSTDSDPGETPVFHADRSFLLLDKKEAALTRLPAKAQKFPHVRPMVKKKPSKYKNCYDFNTHPNVFLVDAYIGPSMARKDLRSIKAEESWYRQSRLASESRDWAFNAGVRGTLLFNQNFLLRIGLHYDQIIETFQYLNQYKLEKQVWDPVTSSWVIVPGGTTYGQLYTKTYNRFGLLDIPLQAGVEVRNGRSGVSIQAGASLNILFWKRGKILSPMEQPASFTPADHQLEVFRPRTGLSVMGSVQWFYHLQPRLRVFAEPYFRQVLRPVTVDAHPVEQRYGIGGVRLGLTKIIGN